MTILTGGLVSITADLWNQISLVRPVRPVRPVRQLFYGFLPFDVDIDHMHFALFPVGQ